MNEHRLRVVVCGTKFGRIYLRAFGAPDFPFELAGILARGSARSHACARHYDVPLFSDPGQLPADIDVACVVVGGAMNAGSGVELSHALMARGIHVLQEHPLHHDELAGCLRRARQLGVVYHLNTHYVHLAPVRRFMAAARQLISRQRPLFVDAACSFQVAYTLFDIIGETLGGVRPWAFADASRVPDSVRRLVNIDVPFRCLDGVIAGTPLTLRMQNQLDPRDPDNYAHFFHRITLGTEGGNLNLVNTHGPVIWCPRPHMPDDVKDTISIEHSAEGHFEFPSATPIGPAEAPNYREILGTVWPSGVRRALLELRSAILDGHDPRRRGQYHLSLCLLARDAMARFGPPELLRRQAPQVLPAAALAPDIVSTDVSAPNF
jgi:thiazolinyl imide reductase